MNRFITFLAAFAMMVVLVPSVSAVDTGPTEISEVSPLTAQYTVPQQFTATASDPDGVASCTLLVSSVHETPMTYNALTDVWEVEYTFITERTANSIRMVCVDHEGNETKGPSRIIEVADAPIDVPDGEGEPDDGEPTTIDATEWTAEEVIEVSPVLIKTVCPGGEDFTHPCRTVYFLDEHGDRHAFPNERAFFTWYDNYDDIHLVTDAVMASYPLGRNVRYHPGVKMVKFQSVPTVYVVGQLGALFPIASEDDARDLYGENWNQQIDDLSEVFATNYSISLTPHTSAELNVDTLRGSVSSINDNLGLAILFD